jgi:dihydroorotate dehydrogenase (NAD+) catalytic subunit
LKPNLTVNLAGLKIRNPTMNAAGVLGISGSLLRRIAEAGAGAVVTKSIGIKAREGYSNPTVVEVRCGLLNAMGLPNPGIKEFTDEIKIAKRTSVPVIVSIYGLTANEFAAVAKDAEKAGADAIELDVSCPHVKEVGSLIGQDPDEVSKVVRKVKSVIKKLVFTKLTPNVTNIVEIAEAAEKAGTDAITAINSVKAMAIDVETKKPILANKTGGLSGPAIKPIAIRCVYEIYDAVKVPIIGCGGITEWQDAVEFMLAGASAIQIGTAIFYKDLAIFNEITAGIQSYLAKKKYRSVKDIVGLSHTS